MTILEVSSCGNLDADGAWQSDASPLSSSQTHASNSTCLIRLQHSQALAEHPESSAGTLQALSSQLHCR